MGILFVVCVRVESKDRWYFGKKFVVEFFVLFFCSNGVVFSCVFGIMSLLEVG